MTSDQIRTLCKISTEELCQIYDKLNNWEWDDRLPSKPEGYDQFMRYERHWWQRRIRTKFYYTRPIQHWIEKIVGLKKLLEHHHIYNLGQTQSQFEQWWKSGLSSHASEN